MARPRSDIGPRLLVAARARFLHDGVDGASLRDIAREAGTSLGMIHYYFPSKDALFLAVLEDVYVRFTEETTALMSSGRPLEERVRELYLRVARASDAEFDVLRLVVREILVSSERRRLLLERFVRGHLPPMVQAVAQGLASGAIDARHPLPAAALTVLSAGVFPQLLRRVLDEQLLPIPLPAAEDLARAIATVVFTGLRPRS